VRLGEAGRLGWGGEMVGKKMGNVWAINTPGCGQKKDAWRSEQLWRAV